MKTTATSTPTSDPHVTLERLDQAAPKPSGKNRSRAEQRHHRDRMKNNRTNQIRESEPGVDLEDFNQRWLNGLDDHPVSKQSEQTTKHNKVNKLSHKERQFTPNLDDLHDDGEGYYRGTDY